MSVVDSNVAILEAGVYTPTQDTQVIMVRIPHNLGAVPDFCMYFSDNFESTVEDTQNYIASGYFAKMGLKSGQTDNTKGMGFYVRTAASNTNAIINYWADGMTAFFTDHDFTFPRYNTNDRLKAGITYHWAIGKFK